MLFTTSLNRWSSPSTATTHKVFMYFCAACGVLFPIVFFASMVITGIIPPMRSSWTAERTLQFWKDHLKGAEAGSSLMLFSGLLFLPFSAAYTAEIHRIPGIHPAITVLQLAAASAGVFTIIFAPLIQATITFRLERSPEMTQMLTDFWWIALEMPFQTFAAQGIAIAFASLVDKRPNPVFPKYLAFVNIFCPIWYFPGIALHTTRTGPIAWHGGLTFWTGGVMYAIQMFLDAYSLVRAVRLQYSGKSDESVSDLEAAPKES